MPRLQKLVNRNRDKTLADARAEGLLNYTSNGSLTDNPYQPGTPQFAAWNEAWNQRAWGDLDLAGPTDPLADQFLLPKKVKIGDVTQ